MAWTAGALALFAFYVSGAPPGLSAYRDCGDLAAAAHSLGVAHPPGYPLYVLLGRAALAATPLGSTAYRLNLLGALCGAAAAALLGWAVARRSGSRLGGAAAALVLAFAPAHAALSRVSEMYSLNALFIAALIALWPEKDDPEGLRRLRLCGLLLGLGLVNHQTLILAVPALLLMWSPPARRLPAAALFFLGGLALLAYLPIRSAGDPAVNWGEADSMTGFFKMLTRYYYGGGARLHPGRGAAASPAEWRAAAAWFGRLQWSELGAAVLALAAWGLWRGRGTRLAWGLALGFMVSGPVFALWSNLDPSLPESAAILQPHLVLPDLFAAALAGLGAATLNAPALAALGAAWLWTAAPRGLPSRGDYAGEDLGRGILNAMEPGALLVDPDDQTAFALSYRQVVLGARPDVIPFLFFRTRWGYERFRRKHPELLPDWEIKSGQELLGTVVSRNLAAGRPLYTDMPRKASAAAFPLPQPPLYRLTAAPSSRLALASALVGAERGQELARPRPRADGLDFFSAHAGAYLTSALNNLGIAAEQSGDRELAGRVYLRALAHDSGLSEAWNNRANVLLSGGDIAAAERNYRAALAIKESAQVRYNLGRALFLQGKLDEAGAEYARVKDADGPPDAANDLGLIEQRQGRPEKAVEVWRELVRTHPRYALAYYNLGTAFIQLKRYEEAYAFLDLYQAQALGPDKEEALKLMREIEKNRPRAR